MSRSDRKLRVHEIDIARPAKGVWRALTETTELARWVGWEADHVSPCIDEVFIDGVSSSEPESYLLLGDRSAHFVEFFIESSGGCTPGSRGWGPWGGSMRRLDPSRRGPVG